MKKSYRILTVFLCLVMFFVAGCGSGGAGFGEGINDPVNLDGVKVLRKPSDYSISEAVGDNSEYYYNLFAGNIMQRLYGAYSNLSEDYIDIYNSTKLLEKNLGIYDEDGKEITDTNVYTYKKNYLYDSIRSSITSIENNYDKDGNLIAGKLVLDLTGWNFNFPNYAPASSGAYPINTNYEYSLGVLNTDSSFASVDYDFRHYTINDERMEINFSSNSEKDWTLSDYRIDDIQATFGTPNTYDYFYYGGQINKDGESVVEGDKTYYFSSPFYQANVAGLEEISALNDYQDALEYAIYLFVLGYDYLDNDGNVNETDLPYFDFQITYQIQDIEVNGETINDVSVPKVSVGGWDGDNYIPIQDALEIVKDSYLKVGNYVGLTDKNKEQIKRFILDYVIGVEKDDNGNYDSTFDITIKSTTKGETETAPTTEVTNTYTINREYEQVIENIIEQSCARVLIGDGADGESVNIDEAFPISQIVDYDGDYFYISVMDEEGNYDDSDVLAHVEEAEYQSLVLVMPKDGEPFPYNLTDIQLIFQYEDTGTTNPELEYLDEITINVGINYYDSATGILTQSQPVARTIKRGLAMEGIDYSAGVDPDKNWLQFTSNELIAGDYGSEKLQYMEKIPVKMSFDVNIDNGVLNAKENGVQIGDYESVINITGNSPAREYYKLNNSSSYGQYATFNETMFEGKTDYIEIYFDVVKEKGRPNVNYNFKVGLIGVWPEDK